MGIVAWMQRSVGRNSRITLRFIQATEFNVRRTQLCSPDANPGWPIGDSPRIALRFIRATGYQCAAQTRSAAKPASVEQRIPRRFSNARSASACGLLVVSSLSP